MFSSWQMYSFLVSLIFYVALTYFFYILSSYSVWNVIVRKNYCKYLIYYVT